MGIGLGLLIPGLLLTPVGIGVFAATADSIRGSSSSIGPDLRGMALVPGVLLTGAGVGLSIAGGIVICVSPEVTGTPEPTQAELRASAARVGTGPLIGGGTRSEEPFSTSPHVAFVLKPAWAGVEGAF